MDSPKFAFRVSFSEGIGKNKVPDLGGYLYTLVVKELFRLNYILVSPSYAPAHEHLNAPLKIFKWPTVDCWPAEALWTFVDGPALLANLDDVGEESCIGSFFEANGVE